jgi:RNA:NAD 2'-phosphotransferase (TPT1/KptA family)
MSAILRHHPPVSIDASGWVALPELQKALGSSVLDTSIREVVEKDEKGRFQVHSLT